MGRSTPKLSADGQIEPGSTQYPDAPMHAQHARIRRRARAATFLANTGVHLSGFENGSEPLAPITRAHLGTPVVTDGATATVVVPARSSAA